MQGAGEACDWMDLISSSPGIFWEAGTEGCSGSVAVAMRRSLLVPRRRALTPAADDVTSITAESPEAVMLAAIAAAPFFSSTPCSVSALATIISQLIDPSSASMPRQLQPQRQFLLVVLQPLPLQFATVFA